MTQQKLSRCITGQQSFRIEELQAVADVLGVTISELLDDEKASA